MDMLVIYAVIFSVIGSLACGAEIPCDLDGANNTCPDGYCCVRDEYLFSLTYCKRYGQEDDPCVIKPSFFECPCSPNHICKSNVQGHITSHFGTCHLNPDLTTESGINEETTLVPEAFTRTDDTGKATPMLLKALTTQGELSSDKPSVVNVAVG